MKVPVLVVGAGPVGLALAGDLGWRDVRSLVVEKTDGRGGQPKMDMVGIRSMEFCRRWGITADVEAAGYNRAYTQDCAWVTDLNGYEVDFHWPTLNLAIELDGIGHCRSGLVDLSEGVDNCRCFLFSLIGVGWKTRAFRIDLDFSKVELAEEPVHA
jgi:hypothetical protein